MRANDKEWAYAAEGNAKAEIPLYNNVSNSKYKGNDDDDNGNNDDDDDNEVDNNDDKDISKNRKNIIIFTSNSS